MTRRSSVALGALLAIAAGTATAHAQPLGTFRWQFQPYCNIVSVVVTQSGGVYRLEGTDDQCGGSSDQASVIGTAFQNPDGTIGFGLNIVSSPGGVPVHVDAEITLSTLSGTWRDNAGYSGPFVFTPGAASGGSPRPVTGTIGAMAINPEQVQLRIGGTCAGAQFVQRINQDGTVQCAPGGTGDVQGVTAGPGLSGGGLSGNVVLGLRTSTTGAFDFGNTSGLVASIDPQSGGTLAATGPGRRFLWYAGKDALRAGQVTGAHWDDVNIGRYSVAMGFDTVASGDTSFAMGRYANASGFMSVALGNATVAAGTLSVALGHKAVALSAARGTFIFADNSTDNDFVGFAPNEFLVRAAGGVGFYTNAALTTGLRLAPSGSQWLGVSDVNTKEHFRDVSDDQLLRKIAAMPVREWSYKAQDSSIRHMGPTAQDFHEAFGLGEDPLRIGTMDANGVALAGVKALENRTRGWADERAVLIAEIERLRAMAPAMEKLRADNAALAERVIAIEQALARLAARP